MVEVCWGDIWWRLVVSAIVSKLEPTSSFTTRTGLTFIPIVGEDVLRILGGSIVTIANITSVSMIGKLSSHYGGNFRATTVNINEILSGKTSFREEVYCDELYLKSIEFDIFVHDEDDEGNEDTEKAGVLIGRLFDIEHCEEDEFDPLAVFDNVDQYTYEIYDMGSKHHGGILSDNIFAIDSFTIYPEYRGKNVGTAVIHILSEVIEAQFNMKAGCLIVVPEPGYDAEKEVKPDETQYQSYKIRCERFWEKLGFECLEDSSYWYFNLDIKMLVNGQNPVKKEEESYTKLVAESATIYEFPSNSDNNEQL